MNEAVNVHEAEAQSIERLPDYATDKTKQAKVIQLRQRAYPEPGGAPPTPPPAPAPATSREAAAALREIEDIYHNPQNWRNPLFHRGDPEQKAYVSGLFRQAYPEAPNPEGEPTEVNPPDAENQPTESTEGTTLSHEELNQLRFAANSLETELGEQGARETIADVAGLSNAAREVMSESTQKTLDALFKQQIGNPVFFKDMAALRRRLSGY